MRQQSNGILLKCEGLRVFKTSNSPELKLEYKDENSGEYKCVDSKDESIRIFVKFRSKFRAAGGFYFFW